MVRRSTSKGGARKLTCLLGGWSRSSGRVRILTERSVAVTCFLGLWSRFSGVVKVQFGYGQSITHIYIYMYISIGMNANANAVADIHTCIHTSCRTASRRYHVEHTR